MDNDKKKSVLYIAYHYPPILGSSGVHRTLCFTRFLAQREWDVEVLTASLKSYERWSEEQLSFIPKSVKVIRAFARNTARHFSWRNKYWSLMAQPDNWQSWIFGGVITGWLRILRNRPSVIVSTYPIASAHIIGFLLHRLTGVPWIADMRDPMSQDGYPANPTKKKIFDWIEAKIVKHCKFVIVTTEGTQKLYSERFPDKAADFWQLIPNGYDHLLFENLERSGIKVSKSNKYVLLHSGVVYPSERDPRSLFEAVSILKRQGKISADTFELRLRATGHDDYLSTLLDQYDIQDVTSLLPTIPYKEALQEMYSADGLLIMQSDGCHFQIPAKVYEYIRVGKPILGLTSDNSDTGRLLSKISNSKLAPMKDAMLIRSAIEDIQSFTQDTEIDTDATRDYSREAGAVKLENLLKQV